MNIDRCCHKEDFSQMKEMMQAMKDFRSGKVALSKDDLIAEQQKLESKGFSNENLNTAIEKYEEMDADANGLSKKELKGFGIKLTPGSFPPGMFIGKGHFMKHGIPKEYLDESDKTEEVLASNDNVAEETIPATDENVTPVVDIPTVNKTIVKEPATASDALKEGADTTTKDNTLVVDGSVLISDKI